MLNGAQQLLAMLETIEVKFCFMFSKNVGVTDSIRGSSVGPVRSALCLVSNSPTLLIMKVI